MFIFVLTTGHGVSQEDFVIVADDDAHAKALLKKDLGRSLEDDEIDVKSSHSTSTPEVIYRNGGIF